MLSFGERLDAVFSASGRLCLGIDPHAFLLDAWNLPDSAAGAREFGLRCVDVAAGVVGIVKPQVAFFERFGSAGFSALEAVLAAARGAGLLVIADAKRGDVGSTVAAYGAAWLTPGSALEADAMTLSAYQGVGSLTDVISLADAGGKGLFILAATSNPESVDTQTAVRDRGQHRGRTVAASIVGDVQQLNSSASGLGSVGVVIGATVRSADYGIEATSLSKTPVLAPGFGEQGALIADLPALFGSVSGNVIANLGRSVLRAGPDGARSELSTQAAVLAEGVAP
ncbi:orotidine-5'-phosphate decarboxylase [Salinibacterium sp. G-O1]|uniref:orotidine-5'-phosphate decarboxylase n=1 Tax=Salinibacterium sp. G-O1 TaxID=3046208 RepID=UPI0024B88241|nr:orotidine-5'-phosphate decarboxylase [Salinibacterium sp. G-O1]MDJ0335185.1 orotidine-5'-phosphate decarboxylase [Salinibacterium sp. G-O1]